MSEFHSSANYNPSRRTKRAESLSLPLSTQPSHSRVILPMVPNAPKVISTTTDVDSPATTPAKRGRKPGPMSRSAREAQRRLNHSIIEKARRTKINDALATLRQLVPVEYGSTHPHNEEDDDDEDDEYTEQGAKKAKPKTKSKGAGKREEKEFKLEILVRTVSFLQDLLKRVDTVENTACQRCDGAAQTDKKRRRSQEDDNYPPLKVSRHSEDYSPKSQSGNGSEPRLPSISSWLPNDVIDPTLNKLKPSASPHVASYLPSPPSSTPFDPIRSTQTPPVLNLGPVATAAMVTPPRTSEDESAASLLLQIASSPPFRPSLPSYSSPNPLVYSDQRDQRTGHVRHAQTPRSLLGLGKY